MMNYSMHNELWTMPNVQHKINYMHNAQYTEVEELLTRRGMSGEDSIAAN